MLGFLLFYVLVLNFYAFAPYAQELYSVLDYKFKKLIGRNDFYFQLRRIITRYRRIGYNFNVMQQSACLVFNPIIADKYAAFFNCIPVGRASDSMMIPT